MSAITVMAKELEAELARRNIHVVNPETGMLARVMPAECAEILRAVIDQAAAVAQAYEPPPTPATSPPPGRALDGGCIASGDASAVPFLEE